MKKWFVAGAIKEAKPGRGSVCFDRLSLRVKFEMPVPSSICMPALCFELAPVNPLSGNPCDMQPNRFLGMHNEL